ncbi:MAG: bacillithiol biosynthesis BshC [Planctomycetota bacterium]|nr:bacillithiol biosynthesis BshC [Planctomycetota bacterium]
MSSPQALAAAHLAGDPLARAWLGEPWSGIRAAADYARRFAVQGAWERAALARWHPLLADPASVVVVTGQQPAVGGGPLYTLVKLAHALALSRRLREEGVPALCWFWCASEDHDLGEANHADLLLRDGRLERVSIDLGGGRAALRWRPASLWWAPLWERCRALFGRGLGSDWLAARAPRAEEGMGAWLCRLLADLADDEALIACEAHELRPLWAERFVARWRSWPAAALEERRRDLERWGLTPFGPLPRPPLFCDRPEGRLPLAEPAAAAPELLSPGAALRPIVQQLALPAALSVLGTVELAYHAAITPAYAAYGVPPPLLVPRCSMTLVPTWIERAAQRLGLAVEALADGAHPEPNPPCDPWSQRLAALAQAIDGLGDGGDARIATAQARLRRELERLRASLARGARAALGLPAPGALASWLHPRGHRQERTLSLFQALWEHGPGLFALLVRAAQQAQPGEHVLVRLGAA